LIADLIDIASGKIVGRLAAKCAGILGVFGATLPFIMVVLLFALELLVAFLQAYVFAILTCIYLNDAFHPGH
jgi:F-type H+-transporting ATPase subunit a